MSCARRRGTHHGFWRRRRMRNVRRILLGLATAVWVVALGAVLAFWWRRYRPIKQQSEADSFNFTHRDPLYWVISSPGHVTLCRQVGRDWPISMGDTEFGGVRIGGVRGPGSMLWNLTVPYLHLVVLLLAPSAWWLLRVRYVARRQRRRAGRGECLGCGYDLTGNASGRCPECGAAIGPAAALPA